MFTLAAVLVLNVCVSFNMISGASIRARLNEQEPRSPAILPPISSSSSSSAVRVSQEPRYLNNTGHPPCDWHTSPNLDMYYESDFRIFHSAPLYVLMQIISEGLSGYRDWWFDTGTLLGLYRDGLIIAYDADVDIWMRDLKKVESMLTDYQTNGPYDFSVQRNAYSSTVLRLKSCDFKKVHADLFSHETRGANPRNIAWLNRVRDHYFLYDGSICEYNFLGLGIPVLNEAETKRRLFEKYGDYEEHVDIRQQTKQRLLDGACPFLKKNKRR